MRKYRNRQLLWTKVQKNETKVNNRKAFRHLASISYLKKNSAHTKVILEYWVSEPSPEIQVYGGYVLGNVLSYGFYNTKSVMTEFGDNKMDSFTFNMTYTAQRKSIDS